MTAREELYKRAFEDLSDFLKDTEGTPAEIKTVEDLRNMIDQLATDPETTEGMRRYGKKLRTYRRQYPDKNPQ